VLLSLIIFLYLALIDERGKDRFFSTLELASGLWQIRVHGDSQEKTAFSTPFALI